MISPESQRYFEMLHETPPFGAHGFDFDDLRRRMATRREPSHLEVRCTAADAAGVPGQWVVASGADPDLRFLYLHGGGFIAGSSDYYLTLAARLSLATGGAVLALDYRLAPEHPFPCGLEDSLRAYHWLREYGPAGAGAARAVVIGGDSAGGGLTLSTLLALRDRGEPLPAAAIAISPFADLTLSGAALVSEAPNDPIMSPLCLPDFVRLYLAGADAANPLASPVFGDYTGLPPLLIQVGEHEIIRDDSVQAAARAHEAGVRATLEIWNGLFHVFQSHEPLLPEAGEAIETIAAFVRTHTTP